MTTTINPLDALLAIMDGNVTARWNFTDAVGSPVSSPGGIGNASVLRFSFLTAFPDYFSTASGFAEFSDLQKQAARNALTSIANVVQLSFLEVQGGEGDISFAMNAQSNSSGYAYYPSFGYSYIDDTITSVNAAVEAGDIWFNSGQTWTAADFALGGWGHGALVHELGHALGLKHPFEAVSVGGYVLDATLDNKQYTVMSYTEHPHNLYRTVTESGSGSYSFHYAYIQPETLMPLDIKALQYLYGANPGFHSGDDTYTFSTSRPFIKTIWDSGGRDTISVANFSRGCVIDLKEGNFSCIRIPSDLLPAGYTEVNSGIYDGTDNLAIAYGSIIENAIGGAGGDRLIGNGVANVLNGGLGADRMTGGDGSDSYYVDNIGDIVTEINGNVGLGGNDIVYSHLATYTLGPNIENGRILSAGSANLVGNSLNNLLYAGSGNNTFSGGYGVDTVSYAHGVVGTKGVIVNLGLTGAQATGASGSDTLIGIENIAGSVYNDRLSGNSFGNRLSGGAGNDTLNGGGGADMMIGEDGSDTYYVDHVGDVVTETNAVINTGGVDLVCVYRSSYTLGANIENGRILNIGTANLSGNSLNNVLYAGDGVNAIDGGSGIDTLSYQFATTTGAGGVSLNLSVVNAYGQSKAAGISGADLIKEIENLIGSNYVDTLIGSASNNVIRGGGGNDTLNGAAGDDILIGGFGRDKLTGGSGNDTFDFNALSEFGLGATRDLIADFRSGEDKIDLSTIDAKTGLAGDQAFAFVANFTATPGQVRYSAGVLSFNTDADTAAEYEIQLIGSVPAALSAADFSL